MSTITPEAVISAYTKSRVDIKALEDQIEVIKEKQRKREEWLLAQLVTLGAQNLRTSAGTVYQTVKESVTCADRDTFFAWVKENDAYEYLQSACSKTAVLELMGDKRENPPPPGIDFRSTRTVGIRKS